MVVEKNSVTFVSEDGVERVSRRWDSEDYGHRKIGDRYRFIRGKKVVAKGPAKGWPFSKAQQMFRKLELSHKRSLVHTKDIAA